MNDLDRAIEVTDPHWLTYLPTDPNLCSSFTLSETVMRLINSGVITHNEAKKAIMKGYGL